MSRFASPVLLAAVALVAISALDLIGYAQFLIPMGQERWGAECFPPPLERHSWVLFLPAIALLLPGAVGLALAPARRVQLATAALVGSSIMFLGAVSWVHRRLFDIAMASGGNSLNPFGVGEVLALVAECIALAVLSVCLAALEWRNVFVRYASLLAFCAASGASWYALQLRSVLEQGWYARQAVSVVALVFAAPVFVATRAHAFDRSHLLRSLDEWPYEKDIATPHAQKCSNEILGLRIRVRGNGMFGVGGARDADWDALVEDVRKNRRQWDDLHASVAGETPPRCEIIADRAGRVPLELLRFVHREGMLVGIGASQPVREVTAVRGVVSRVDRCFLPVTISPEGRRAASYDRWDELAVDVERGVAISLE